MFAKFFTKGNLLLQVNSDGINTQSPSCPPSAEAENEAEQGSMSSPQFFRQLWKLNLFFKNQNQQNDSTFGRLLLQNKISTKLDQINFYYGYLIQSPSRDLLSEDQKHYLKFKLRILKQLQPNITFRHHQLALEYSNTMNNHEVFVKLQRNNLVPRIHKTKIQTGFISQLIKDKLYYGLKVNFLKCLAFGRLENKISTSIAAKYQICDNLYVATKFNQK